MPKSKSKLTYWKKQIVALPVIGPSLQSGYRKLNGKDVAGSGEDRLKSKPETKRSPVARPLKITFAAPTNQSNHLDFAVDGMRGTQLLDGNAVLSFPNVAKTLESAFIKTAEKMPIILFPASRGNEIIVGLNEKDVLPFARYFGEHLGISLSWDDLDIREDSAKASDRMRQLNRLIMTISVGDEYQFQIFATLYFERDGKLESRDNRNRMLRHIQPANIKMMEKCGIHDMTTLLGGEPIDRPNMPVDVVFTWVNHTDPDWCRLYYGAKGLPYDDVPDTKSLDDVEDTDANSLARFTNRDELLYSIRSIEQYIPWVRRIFVFSNCAPPDWLAASDRIVWVRHEEVIPTKYLPTFNSHAIESSLHLIPNLSESFLYFNDDFFINEPLPLSFFFASNNAPNANLEDYGVVNGPVDPADKDYLNAARNGAALLCGRFGVVPTRLHKHTPYALRKSILQEIEDQFPDAIHHTRAAQFRSSQDVSLVSFLFHHYVYATGRGTQSGFRTRLVKNSNKNIKHVLAGLTAKSGIRTFCINDGVDSHTDETWNTLIPKFLEERFPLRLADEHRPSQGS